MKKHRASLPARTLSALTLLTIAFLGALPATVQANIDCPAAAPMTDSAHKHTKKAATELMRFFEEYEVEEGIDKLNSKKIELLTSNYFANQQQIVNMAYIEYCLLLRESAVADKAEALQVADSRLRGKNNPRPCVWTSAPDPDRRCGRPRPAVQAPVEAGFRSQFASVNHARTNSFRSIPAAAAAAPDREAQVHSTEQVYGDLNDGDSGERVEPGLGYLQDAPYVINEANRHFVQAATVYSCEGPEDAIDEAMRLKRIAPEFDFAVFEPVSGNDCNWAIMAATWTTQHIQAEALKRLSRYIPGAIPWSCRSVGEFCL